MDTAFKHIITLGPGTLLAKLDIKSAFRLLPRGIGRGFPWFQETPFNFQYITQSSISDITNDINDTVRLNIDLVSYTLPPTFCTRMEYRHLQSVHYLEFTRTFNYEVPDDFRWV